MSIRYANIPNNCELELKPSLQERHESKVTIALQIESTGRKIGDFDPTTNLWDIINKLAVEHMSGHSQEDVTCIYMQKEVNTNNRLQFVIAVILDIW